MTLKSIDIFSGAGGLTEGLASAGIECILGVDADRDCFITFSEAHGPGLRLALNASSITNLGEWRGEPDILAGGPPCQPFSVHGRQQGAADKRDCIPLFILALGILKPRAFILENVPSLAAPRHRDYFMARLTDMVSLGYGVQYAILDAAAFGVPQHRRRLFVVGFLKGDESNRRPFQWPNPTHGPGLLPYVTVREALLAPVPSRLEELNRSRVTYARNPVWRPRLLNSLVVNGKGRVLDFDAPAPTVTAQSSGNGAHILDMCGELRQYHYSLMLCKRADLTPSIRQGEVIGARRLTWREASALQGFPDSYPFQGSVSSKYSQIGNAVSPPLAEAVGRAVVAHLQAEPIRMGLRG